MLKIKWKCTFYLAAYTVSSLLCVRAGFSWNRGWFVRKVDFLYAEMSAMTTISSLSFATKSILVSIDNSSFSSCYLVGTKLDGKLRSCCIFRSTRTTRSHVTRVIRWLSHVPRLLRFLIATAVLLIASIQGEISHWITGIGRSSGRRRNGDQVA